MKTGVLKVLYEGGVESETFWVLHDALHKKVKSLMITHFSAHFHLSSNMISAGGLNETNLFHEFTLQRWISDQNSGNALMNDTITKGLSK